MANLDDSDFLISPINQINSLQKTQLYLKHKRRLQILTLCLVLLETSLIVFSIAVKREFGLFYLQNVLVFVGFLIGFISVWHGVFCHNNAKVELVLAEIFYVASFFMVIIQSISGAMYLYFIQYYMGENCHFLFGCSSSQISTAITVLVPIILIGDIAFVALAWYFLRAIFKFIKAAELYNGRIRVVKLIYKVGTLLEISKVCTRKRLGEKERKTLSSDHEIRERRECCNSRILGVKCFCTKGRVALSLLIIFTFWIGLNGMICILAGKRNANEGWRIFCVLFNAMMSMLKCAGCDG